MPRRKVTRLRKFCGQLAGHSWKQAERVTQEALKLVESCLAVDGELDLLAFIACLGELLERHRDSLTATDNQHQHELTVDRSLRQERDAITAAVREKLLQVRDSLDGLFGPGGTAKIIEDGPAIPTDPVALHQYAGHTLDNLDNDDFPMPTPLQTGFTLDRNEVVSGLRGPHEQLGAVLKQLEGTESDSKYSQASKDVHVDDTEVFAFKVARFYEAFFALVGLDGLARRVRRSSHRASGDDDVETPEAAGDASAGDAGEGESEEPAPEPSATEAATD